MCGIAGIADFSGSVDQDVVERMSQAQFHRGPDGRGLHADDCVSLGHRRLSIIDLSEAALQPMPSETESVWTIYNGEIYNYAELRSELITAGHRFRSRCDTEVLVHGYEEWGEEKLLARLRGMFAFAIYDRTRKRLILARDRLGIKPLYYAHCGGRRIAFASEVRAIREAGIAGVIDRIALAGFLLLGSVPAPRTIFEDVKCLLPGHYLVADTSGVRTRSYWDLWFAKAADETTQSELGDVLRDAVRRHLVSDVPLGVFLSGGVDSAGLVALTRQLNTRVKTLTISFGETEFNEGATAQSIASHFDTEHHDLRVGGSDFVDGLPKILKAMDQPTNDGVNTYFVARAAREAGLTVVLSGLGGDELFWGYPHHRWMKRNSRPLALFATAPVMVQNACIRGAVALGRLGGRESWMRASALQDEFGIEGLYLALRGFFPAEQAQCLLGISADEMRTALAETIESLRPSEDAPRADSSTTRFNYVEMKRYLHDQLLRDTDVFSMAHSIEVRVPYLDDEVVALASSLPKESKMRTAENKPLLVDAIGDPVVAAAARRPKRGFSLPIGRWMSQRGGTMREMAMAGRLLEPAAVSKFWSAFEQGRLHWSRAWSLVVLGARA